MRVTPGKIASVIIAAAWFAVVVAGAGWTWGWRLSLALMLPLALIWFPEKIGGATGYIIHYQRVDEKTPPILITVMGWFFLVGLPLVLYYLWQRIAAD